MRVGDILRANRQQLVSCAPDESVEAVATRLSTCNIGALPVRGAGGALVGIISERDLVRAFAKDSARLRERRVRDLMSRDVVTCAPEESVVAAEKLMNEHRIRHLPVVEGARLVGMLSMRDTVVARLKETREEVSFLRDAVIAARHA
ncbi:MAG: CBS domain-containing protein [Roseiarcus sp.]|jgi:CBS domain-containing protein